jgi:hypothetical protein
MEKIEENRMIRKSAMKAVRAVMKQKGRSRPEALAPKD